MDTISRSKLKKHTFTVQVSDGLLTDEEVITITVNAVHGNNSAIDEPAHGNGSTIEEPALTEIAINILVNGKIEHAGVAKITEANGQKMITIAVDEQKLMQRLQSESSQAIITIPVTIDSNVIITELNGSSLKGMEKQRAIIVLQTNNAAYTLPVEQIDIAAISAQFGVNLSLEDVKVKIEIADRFRIRCKLSRLH